jgi:hypothetical protein
VVGFEQRRSTAREVRRAVAAAFGQRRSRNGADGWRLYGVGVACARHGRGAWQPHGERALTGGPGAERERLIGGSLVSAIFELKFTPRKNSSKQITKN